MNATRSQAVPAVPPRVPRGAHVQQPVRLRPLRALRRIALCFCLLAVLIAMFYTAYEAAMIFVIISVHLTR